MVSADVSFVFQANGQIMTPYEKNAGLDGSSSLY